MLCTENDCEAVAEYNYQIMCSNPNVVHVPAFCFKHKKVNMVKVKKFAESTPDYLSFENYRSQSCAIL